jgi:hypothetical protein
MRPCPFSALEAVATLTPAAAATSRSVTGGRAKTGADSASEDMFGEGPPSGKTFSHKSLLHSDRGADVESGGLGKGFLRPRVD